MPAARPINIAPRTVSAGGAATATARLPSAPMTRLAPTAARTRPGWACRIQPPSGRETTPSTSVSAAITPAAPRLMPPSRCSSVTTQFPSTTLSPSEQEKRTASL